MMNRIIMSVIAASMVLLLSGCKKEPPKCSDEKTLALVRNIVIKQIDDSSLEVDMDENDIKESFKIEFPTASAYDEKIGRYSCNAKLIIVGPHGGYQVPAQYTSQLDDNNQHVVSVGGFMRGDLGHMGVNWYGAKKAKKEKMEFAQLAAVEKSAEQGDAEAQFNLGKAYYEGKGAPKDAVKAAQWWGKAAEQGHAKAQYNIGMLYWLGQGVTKDYAKAAQWVKKSADQGQSKAQFILGAMYLEGQGVIRDQQAGCKLLRAAADQGEKDAIEGYNKFCAGSSVQSSSNQTPMSAQNAQSVKPPKNMGFLKNYKVSFDCSKASNYVENSICANSYLGQLDGLLRATYKSRLDPQFGADKNLMKKDQTAWIKKQRACTSENCIEQVYKERIKELCEMPVVSGAHPGGDCNSLFE